MTKEILFDRELLRQNCVRIQQGFVQHNFLHHEVANRIAENVEFLNRDFDSVLEIGAKDDYLLSLIQNKTYHKENVMLSSACPEPVEGSKHDSSHCPESCFDPSTGSGQAELSMTSQMNSAKIPSYISHKDSEILSIKPNSFDLILSNLNLHFINEIPQFLLQIKQALKPDGIFIASFFGEENLRELAHVLHQSEIEIYGGISPRMPPTIDVKTAAALLQKAGFADPISEFAKIEVNYSDPMNLLKDLKFMGQGNILTKRSRRFFTKKFLAKILENYRKLYGTADNAVSATFEIITVTGWK